MRDIEESIKLSEGMRDIEESINSTSVLVVIDGVGGLRYVDVERGVNLES